MDISISRIDRIPVEIDVTATLPDGSAATVVGVDVAVLPPRGVPTGSTQWTVTSFATGKATLLIAGPDRASSEAFTIPTGGADLWVRATGADSTQAVRAGRVNIR